MKITVKTAGLLERHLPPDRQGKSAEIEVGQGATPLEVMTQLGFPQEDSYLVVRNGTAVPRAEWATRELAEGDSLAIMPPLKGG